MSVLEYTYPRDETSLEIEVFVPILQATVSGVVLLEKEFAGRSKTKWNSLLLGHSKTSQFKTLIARTTNKKSSIRDVCERSYTKQYQSVVTQATTLFWSQLKMGDTLSLTKMKAAFALHYQILLTLVRTTGGVIHLPESEKLYSASGFSRYVGSLSD